MRGIRALLGFFVGVPIGGVLSFFIWLAIIGIGIQVVGKAMFGEADPSRSFALAAPWALALATLGALYGAYLYYQVFGELMWEGVGTIAAIILSGAAVTVVIVVIVWAFSSPPQQVPGSPPEVAAIPPQIPPNIPQPAKPKFQPPRIPSASGIDAQDETYCLNVIQRAKARHGSRWRRDLSQSEQIRCRRQIQENTARSSTGTIVH